MAYRIAGIDVHKKMLAVVIADVEVEGEYELSGSVTAAILSSCAHWRNGYLRERSRKS
jgi:hypothetical protein